MNLEEAEAEYGALVPPLVNIGNEPVTFASKWDEFNRKWDDGFDGDWIV